MDLNELTTSGSAFLVSFLINFLIGAAAFFIFCYIRPNLPNVFQPKCSTLSANVQKSEDETDDEILLPEGFFGWISTVFSHSLAWIEIHRGLDAMMYQRFLRSSTIFFIVCSFFAFITVVPANGTGANKDLDPSSPLYVEGLQVISMSNIESGSYVLWVHAVAVVIVTLFGLFLIFWDYTSYYSARQRYRTLPTVDHCSVMVGNIKSSSLQGSSYLEKKRSFYQHFDTMFPGSVRSVQLVIYDPQLEKWQKERNETKRKLERALWEQENGKNPKHKLGFWGLFGEEVESIEYYKDKIKNLREHIEIQQNKEDHELTEVGFVTFNSVETAEKCLKIKKEKELPKFDYQIAPEAAAVHWDSLHIKEISRYGRKIFANSIVVFMVCFWAIPTSFVQTLGNLRELAKYELFSWLNDLLDALGPGIEGLINAYLPSLLLIVLVSLVVPVITALSVAEGRSTLIKTDQIVFDRFFLFLLMNVFFVSTIAGSFLNQVFAIFEGEISLLELLAESLPGQGGFFIQYVLVKFASLLLYKLLRPDYIVIRWIKLKYFAKTETEKMEAEKPPSLNYSVNLAWDFLVFQISCCYSVMFPFILLFASAYFGISYLVNHYNLIYVHSKPYEGEARVWQRVYIYFFVALTIFQLTMIGLLTLNQSFSWILVAISLGFTILIAIILKPKIEKGNFGYIRIPSFLNYALRKKVIKKELEKPLIDDARLNHYGSEKHLDHALNTTYYRQPELAPVGDDLDFHWRKKGNNDDSSF